MKTIIAIAAVMIQIQVFGRNYYVSSSIGKDSYTSIQAQNLSTPWKTITQINNSMSTFQAGDSILFKRGDIFYGELVITRSGIAGKPISFGAWGRGSNPVIAATQIIKGWSVYSGSIYSASCAGGPAYISNIIMNNKTMPMGRYPKANSGNNGYLTISSTMSTPNVFACNSLASSPTWIGSNVVVRTQHWLLDTSTVKSQSGTQITMTTPLTASALVQSGFGFFFQNSLQTLTYNQSLDQNGEWYYNGSAKKLYIYATKAFDSAEVAWYPSCLIINGYSYISIFNITFKGSLNTTIDCKNASYVSFTNNQILFSGQDAGTFTNCYGLNFQYNFINYTNNNALNLTSPHATISNNIIKNTGMIAGMGKSFGDTYNAVMFSGSGSIMQYNIIDSTGYIPINAHDDSITIKNNFIEYYTMVKDDGGAIYMHGNGTTILHNRLVTGNIIMYAQSANPGTSIAGYFPGEGIYSDDQDNNLEISFNTVYSCINHGIFLHNSNNINVHDNTVYNNGEQLYLCHDNIATTFPLYHNTIKNNIFVSQKTTQQIVGVQSISDFIDSSGTLDSNAYCRPLSETTTFTLNYYPNGSNVNENITFANWQKISGFDAHSTTSPATFPSNDNPIDFIFFFYNVSKKDTTISLSSNCIDVHGNKYSGSVTLSPYTSVILFFVSNAVKKYTLVVNGGSGSGNYSAGTAVTISAALAPAGQEFDKWTGVASGIKNIHAENTVIIMTDSNTSVYATYKEITFLGSTGNNQVTCYPNPSNSYICVSNCSSYNNISVYSVKGINILNKNIFQENEVTLNIENLSRGEYLIKLCDETSSSKLLYFIKE